MTIITSIILGILVCCVIILFQRVIKLSKEIKDNRLHASNISFEYYELLKRKIHNNYVEKLDLYHIIKWQKQIGNRFDIEYNRQKIKVLLEEVNIATYSKNKVFVMISNKNFIENGRIEMPLTDFINSLIIKNNEKSI